MKDLRPRLGFGDAAIVLGVALLLFSTGGMLFDSAARIGFFQQTRGEGRVIGRVYRPPALATQQEVARQEAARQEAVRQEVARQEAVRQEVARQEAALQAAKKDQFAPTAPAVQPALASQPGQTIPQTAPLAPATQTPVNNNSFLVPGTPPPTAIPSPEALVPQRIIIPAIHLDAPVLPAAYQLVQIDGGVFQQWDAPDQYAAGWQQTSALLGVPGNTVLNGHHNIDGMVFGNLLYLKEGDAIEVVSGDWIFSYTVMNKMILPERDEPLSVRLENARWLQPSTDERLTLVTCWPPNNNTYRLFIVARPVGKRKAAGRQGP